jgi:hypothetical protein
MPLECVSEISTSTPSSSARVRARPESRTAGGPSPPPSSSLGGERPFGVGEQALRQPRPAVERLREAVDLQEVQADAGHGAPGYSTFARM